MNYQRSRLRLLYLLFWSLPLLLSTLAIVIRSMTTATTTSISSSLSWANSNIWFIPAMGSYLVPVDMVAYLLGAFISIQLLLAALILMGVGIANSISWGAAK